MLFCLAIQKRKRITIFKRFIYDSNELQNDSSNDFCAKFARETKYKIPLCTSANSLATAFRTPRFWAPLVYFCNKFGHCLPYVAIFKDYLFWVFKRKSRIIILDLSLIFHQLSSIIEVGETEKKKYVPQRREQLRV